jgi:hypothetical protein
MFGSATEMLQSKLPDVASCLVLDIRLPGLSALDFQTELASFQTKVCGDLNQGDVRNNLCRIEPFASIGLG